VRIPTPSPFARAAFALLFTSTTLSAAPMAGANAPRVAGQAELVQMRCQPEETPEACAARRLGGGGGGGEARPRRQQRQEQPAEEAPRPRRQQQQQEQPAEEAPRPRRQLQQEQPAEEILRPRRQLQQEQPAEAPRPRRQQQQEQPAEAPRPRRQLQQEQPAEEILRPRRQQPQEQPAEAPRPRRQLQQEQPPEEAPRPRRQPQAEQPAGELPELRPGAGEEGQGAQRPRNRRQGTEQPSDTPVLQPDQGQQGQPEQRPRGQRQGTEQPADTPAVQPAPDAGGERPQTPRSRRDQNAAPQPVPTDDRSAQQGLRDIRIEPVGREQGRRIESDRRFNPRERKPRSAEVVRELGDRFVLQLGGSVYVESDERPRMRRNASEFYTEELPGGRVREVVIRRDGTRVITIYNINGDIIRRSRIGTDDREYVLVYVSDDDLGYLEDWRDPGLDLPPLVLDIPREEYILDAEYVQSDEDYYTFLEQPPVEAVERLYSIDEVKRSARIRQKTRRIDLDTITFEFGSDTIPEDQISRLEGVANAIQRLLEKNPAETILIEGHTDAVGSEYANLALSDRRAEAVATALSNVFEIPPENLTTQGYGEEFLKVQSDGPERENRRVAIRRITPLVAPVASAN
jgi:outer membrane protein OmpA-like peptidoglycan-associated protein